MFTFSRKFLTFLTLLMLAGCASTATEPNDVANPLISTSWQLVNIEYMDDTTITPDERNKYTIAFDATGRVNIKADCNRLNGAYIYSSPSGLQFGPLMSTRAACPPESLYNRIAKDMPNIRSFVIKDGNLHLALMVDGGIYHFSPMP
jgi:para-nitrobenzyl esterase